MYWINTVLTLMVKLVQQCWDRILTDGKILTQPSWNVKYDTFYVWVPDSFVVQNLQMVWTMTGYFECYCFEHSMSHYRGFTLPPCDCLCHFSPQKQLWQYFLCTTELSNCVTVIILHSNTQQSPDQTGSGTPCCWDYPHTHKQKYSILALSTQAHEHYLSALFALLSSWTSTLTQPMHTVISV